MAIAIREASPSHLLFKVESFSLLNKCNIDNYESPEFDAGNNKWRLRIYPNGHGTERTGDNVSVYLVISGTTSLPENWEVHAVFSIFIFNQNSGNYHHTNGNTRRFFQLRTEWGVPNFISKEDLTTPSNGYLIDDCCVFGAEVFVIDNVKVPTRCLSLKAHEQVPYKHAIKISDFSTLQKEKQVWYSEEFTIGGYKWKIQLYPNGNGEEVERNLSMYIMYVPFNNEKSHDRVMVCFTICLKNQLASDKNHEYKSPVSRWYDASTLSWGWRKFISLDKLNAAGGGFMVKDTCLFEIEINVQAVAK